MSKPLNPKTSEIVQQSDHPNLPEATKDSFLLVKLGHEPDVDLKNSHRPLNTMRKNRRFLVRMDSEHKTDNSPITAIVWTTRKEYVVGHGLLPPTGKKANRPESSFSLCSDSEPGCRLGQLRRRHRTRCTICLCHVKRPRQADVIKLQARKHGFDGLPLLGCWEHNIMFPAESSIFRDSPKPSSPAVPNPCGARARPGRLSSGR